MRALGRIHLRKREGMRWSETATAASEEAAGARLCAGAGYAWLASSLRGWAGSWSCVEHNGVLGFEQ